MINILIDKKNIYYYKSGVLCKLDHYIKVMLPPSVRSVFLLLNEHKMNHWTPVNHKNFFFPTSIFRASVSVTLWVVHSLPVWSENRNGRKSAGSRQPLMPTEPRSPARAHFVLLRQQRRQNGKKSWGSYRMLKKVCIFSSIKRLWSVEVKLADPFPRSGNNTKSFCLYSHFRVMLLLLLFGFISLVGQ